MLVGELLLEMALLRVQKEDDVRALRSTSVLSLLVASSSKLSYLY